MMVGRGRVRDQLSAGVARHHHRDLGLQVECLLGDAGLFPQRSPGVPHAFPPAVELHLSPAVVSPVRPLQVNPSAQFVRGPLQVIFPVDRPVRSHGKTLIAQPVFLLDPVLHHGQDLSARAHRGMAGCGIERGQGDLLDLQRDHVAAARQVSSRAGIVPRAHKAGIHHKTGGARRVGVHYLHPVAQRTRSHGGHAAQLTTAQDADGRALNNRCHPGSSASSTSRLRACRQARSRLPSSGSLTARMATASNAALAAPGLPMARVATGTPLGICTMESRESIPLGWSQGRELPAREESSWRRSSPAGAPRPRPRQ